MKSGKHDPPEYQVGERIVYFRKKKNLTTNKLANLAGVSQSYLRDVELGNKNPTVEFLYQICKALDLTLKEFFDDDTRVQFRDEPLIGQLYEMNDRQRNALSKFISTIMDCRVIDKSCDRADSSIDM